MKADYVTYKQATNVSIGGMALQIALTVALLIYSFVSRDYAAFSGMIFSAAGIVGWITLAVVFDQHRRERIESMEADALAAGPLAGTSVFSATQDDFRPAAKRLAMLHKYFVPSMAILLGGLLVGLGLWRFFQAQSMYAPEDFRPPLKEGWAMGIGLAIAVLGFGFARFVAGLAKFGPWANLRAGASFSIGTALIGLTIAVANFIDLVGPDTGVRYVLLIVPAFVILIGIEFLFNFVLGIYRPRRAGEIPRPAFDSRLLGLLAAPDRIAQSISDAINYQLGFDVTSGWFYQLLSRALLPLLLLGMLIVWLLSSVAVIRPHQRALILRFGALAREDIGPGVHFKWPWPIETVYIPEFIERDARGRAFVTDYTVTGIRTIELGTAPPATKEPILWTNDHAGDEVFQLVRTSAQFAPKVEPVPGSVSSHDTKRSDLSDFSMVSAEIPLQYVIKDVLRFDELGTPTERDELLKAAARHVLVRFFQTVTLDEVLGGDRLNLGLQMKARVQEAFDRLNIGPDGKPRGAGVEIVHLALSGVHPPKDVAQSFETPVQADQKMQANLEAAEGAKTKSLTQVVGDLSLANDIITQLVALDSMRDAKAAQPALRDQELKIQSLLESAGGSASASLAKAQADRWNRTMSIRGIASRQQGRNALFTAAPQVYKASAYFSTLTDILKDSRVYIVPEKGVIIDYDIKDKDFGQDIFRNETIGSGN